MAVLAAAGPGRAEEMRGRKSVFAFSAIGIDAGLPSNVARLVLQTRAGYLWIGTEAGLARYDGVRLTAYRHANTPELPDNLIRGLHEDAEGTLWVATQGGLTRYRAGEFAEVKEFRGHVVSSVAGDGAGTVWFGTQDAGLWRWTAGRLAQVSDAVLLRADGGVQSLFCDAAGTVWVGLLDGGMCRVDAGKITQPAWGAPGSAPGALGAVMAMAEHPRGVLWMAGTHGLSRFGAGEWRRIDAVPNLGSEAVTDVIADRSGRLWVAARNRLWVGDGDAVPFTPVPVPASNFVRGLTQDREGSYWLQTSGDGIIRMRESAFRMAYTAPAGSTESARSVAVDAQGAIWCSVGQRGLMRLGPDGRTITYPLPPELDADIGSVLCAADGSVWVASRVATGRLVDGRIEVLPEARGVRALFQDRRGVIWLGLANRGVLRYQDGGFTPVPGLDPPVYRSATCFAEGADGSVYIGFSQGGIVRWKDGVKEVHNTGTGLPDAEIRTLYLDDAGNLWAGSKRRALAVLAGGRWHSSSVLTEILSDLVTAIAEDGVGNLWLGTPKGLVWAPKAELLAVARGERQTLQYHLSGEGEGVRGGLIGYGTQPSWAKTPAGELLFVSRPGLLAVQPAELTSNPVPPPVVIEELVVDGRVVPTSVGRALPPGTRNVAINYAALSFVQPGRVVFRYQLVGHDHDWVEAGSRRTAYYTNLAPGAYEFRVIAANENGVLNETGATLAVVQQAWFYQTGWFYLVVLAGVSALVAGMHRWRTADLRHQVQVQTRQIREQLAKEAGLQAELERSSRLESLGLLAGGIAHDFNNLLTVIMGNLGLISLDTRAMNLVGEQVRAADGATRRARDVTQQLLTFAKGGDPVRAAILLPEIVREAAGFASHGSNVRIEFDFAPDLPPADADGGQISRVVHNLVLNALQAMPAGGVVRITLTREVLTEGQVARLAPGAYIRLAVADTGRGIEAGKLSRIFDPYFSTKRGNSGLGLATVRSIVHKHQGQVEVTSVPDVGTTFTLWLPVASGGPGAAGAPRAAAAAPARGLRVLFMDDEEEIRTLAAQLIQRLGHEVTLVEEGAAAVRAYTTAKWGGRPYDVVILDLTVPGGLGGKDTLAELHRFDPAVRAIASSGYSSDPVMANHQAYGFRAVVPKPYDVTTFVKALDAVSRS